MLRASVGVVCDLGVWAVYMKVFEYSARMESRSVYSVTRCACERDLCSDVIKKEVLCSSRINIRVSTLKLILWNVVESCCLG